MSSQVGSTGHPRSYDPQTYRDAATSRRRGGAYPDVDLLPDWKAEVVARLGWFVAILVGALSVVAVRIGLFHYMGEAMITDTPEITTAIEAGGAVVVSFLAFLLFPYRGARYVVLLLAGIAVSSVAMHNAVHAKPGTFSLFFSPEWTARVTETTEPGSLLVLGKVVPIEFGTSEKKEMPTIRRAGKL